MRVVKKKQLEHSVDLPAGASQFSALFAEHGFAVMPGILTPGECGNLVAALKKIPVNGAWQKDLAARSPLFFHLGADARIASLVSQVIGDDVILWGAKIVERRPGQVHPFHSDLETAEQPGKTVSVWIGLENTSRNSALKLVTRSHRFGATIQQVAFEADYERGEPSDETVLDWARNRNLASEIVQPDIANGDAIFFDGRIWHGSENADVSGVRAALLLQYSTPETRIRMPVRGNFCWPLKYDETIKPPVVLIQGIDRHGVNHIVPAPTRESPGQVPLAAFTEILQPDGMETNARGFRSFPVASGSTPCLDVLACHWSILQPKATPHNAHRHRDEEVLVMLDGLAELEWFDSRDPEKPIRRCFTSGDLIYYESEGRHTLRNTSEKPAAYMMFKWHGRAESGQRPELSTAFFKSPESGANSLRHSNQEISRELLFAGGTRFLRKLQCHRTILAPGAGYRPHRDPYDVAIIVLRGVIHVRGQDMRAFGVAFFPAGELHGMQNPGTENAEYMVLELHGHYYRPSLTERFHFAAHYAVTKARRAVQKILRVGKRMYRGSSPS